MEIGLTLQSQAMWKDAVYYSGQVIELYKLVYVPFKTDGHNWGPSLVRVKTFRASFSFIVKFSNHI